MSKVAISKFGVGLGIGTALLLEAATSPANITWNLQPTGTGAYDWTLRQHWTFNEEGASSTYGPCSGNCNYHLIGANTVWGGAAKAAPECLEVTTQPGLYTSNPDTVIEVQDPLSANWLMVNDDYGGTLQSHARFWIQAASTPTFFIRVRAYGQWDNSQEFFVTITRRDLTEAACTSGQTVPWAQIVQSPRAAVQVTLSNFH